WNSTCESTFSSSLDLLMIRASYLFFIVRSSWNTFTRSVLYPSAISASATVRANAVGSLFIMNWSSLPVISIVSLGVSVFICYAFLLLLFVIAFCYDKYIDNYLD